MTSVGPVRASRKLSRSTEHSRGNSSSEQSPKGTRNLTNEFSLIADSSARRELTKRDATHLDAEADKAVEEHETATNQKRDVLNDSSLNVCICQPEPKIPRPRNAFILYRQHHQADVIAQNPGLTNPEISKIIGEKWRHQNIDMQREWKKIAEEEKSRHQQQYPDYRYQPKRTVRKSSNAESITSPSARCCSKCGGRTTTSPTTPTTAFPPRPMLPPLTPSSAEPTSRYLPAMHSLNIVSPHCNRGRAPLLGPISPPDAKRRRFSMYHIPNGSRPSIGTPYTGGSPYHEAFGRAEPSPRYPTAEYMGPLPRPVMLQPPPRPKSLTSPTLQTGENPSRGAEVMGIPYLGKIAILGRISPPYRKPTKGPRGSVIAIEGEDFAAVTMLGDWLGELFSRPTELFDVRTADGPSLPVIERELEIADYQGIVQDWHAKGKEIVKHITAVPRPIDEDTQNSATRCIPVVILKHFQLFASDAGSTEIKSRDNYSSIDHWQWMATLWRGIIGPDITVYIKDVAAEDYGKETVVEVRENIRCIVVRKKHGSIQLEGKELRRVAFELGEYVRGIGQPKEEAKAVAK